MTEADRLAAAQGVIDQLEAGVRDDLAKTPHAILLKIFNMPRGEASSVSLERLRAIGGDDFIYSVVMTTVVMELQRRAVEQIKQPE
jgi:hypothetical protein